VSLGSMPYTVVVCVPYEDGSLTAEFVLVNSWEWNGIVVPVDNDRWASNVMHIALDILVKKHLCGREVVFVGYEMAVVFAVYDWIQRFGRSPYELWYDERVDEDGVERKKVVTFSMFAWAVRRGVISEEDFLEKEGSMRGLLYLAAGLCHGKKLVYGNVVSYVRCVIGAFNVRFVVDLHVSGV